MYNNTIFPKSDDRKNGLLLVFRLKLIREVPCKSVVDFAFCPAPKSLILNNSEQAIFELSDAIFGPSTQIRSHQFPP
jgi:hypothetical protein